MKFYCPQVCHVQIQDRPYKICKGNFCLKVNTRTNKVLINILHCNYGEYVIGYKHGANVCFGLSRLGYELADT